MDAGTTLLTDTPALRLRLAHLVGATGLDPPAMPAAATLVVRRLADPAPRHLVVTWDDPRPDPAWERAAPAAVERLSRRAARPIAGPVPSDAEAVRFDDAGEMLACLAGDLLAGDAASRWWWRALFRGAPSWGALLDRLRGEPRVVPAALERLASHSLAAAVVARLSPAEAWALLVEVVAAHGLGHLTRTPASRGERRPGAAPGTGPEGTAERRRERIEPLPTARPTASAPWEPTVPAPLVGDGLGWEREALLGVGLLLHRDPLEATRRRFDGAFQAWRAVCEGARAATASTATAHEMSPGERDDAARARAVDEAATPPDAPAPGGNFRAARPHADVGAPAARRTRPDDAARSSADERVSRRSTATAARAVEQGDTAVPATDRDRRTPSAGGDARRRPSDPARPCPAPSASGRPTRIGGVLFLVNVLVDLGLPRQVEDQLGIPGEIDGWGWIELFGRCLLGAERTDLADDPLWEAMRELEGRPPTRALGAGFVGRDRYRLPAGWAPATERLALRVGRRRCQLWHPAGFAVADRILRTASPGTIRRAAREWRRAEGVHPARLSPAQRVEARHRGRCAPLGLTPAPPLRRFLGFLLPYVRWRLRKALDLATDAAIAPALLERRGRLFVSATHVELHMGLAQVSVPVRLAGLDADPGWVPWLGRVVTYRFD